MLDDGLAPNTPVLTRRGRAALTGAAVLVALAVALGVQSLAGGSPPDPTARAIAAAAVATGEGVQVSPAAPDDPAETVRSGSAPAAPSSPPPVQAPPVPPAVVNGRTQPPVVAVPAAASGQLVTVAGSAAPVTGSRVWAYRVEVEQGLPIHAAGFADAVHATLSDERGWTAHGNAFQRVDADAVDFRLILASPALTDQLCAPLLTRGRVSCRNGDLVVLNALRWVEGTEDYLGDVASYREYLVNHEVGHRLGRSHVECTGAGEPAPVMMQQTYGLDGCAQNPWPLPSE